MPFSVIKSISIFGQRTIRVPIHEVPDRPAAILNADSPGTRLECKPKEVKVCCEPFCEVCVPWDVGKTLF